MLTSNPSSDYLNEISPNVDDTDPLGYPVGRVNIPTLTLTGALARQEFARLASEQDEEPKSDSSLLNPRVMPYGLEAAGREERSPKSKTVSYFATRHLAFNPAQMGKRKMTETLPGKKKKSSKITPGETDERPPANTMLEDTDSLIEEVESLFGVLKLL
ncbi:hypothetical protein NDU88_001932 [Pleurodeles waltl]|uniref:Uncharacterized protein n=1 Tax=Pleurodeles waltl TaxID=8319 RepID=A0AAV7KSS9_PLEWA|nr:hypothetical protein NDU88_001932 [Pleurodeles waltl]